MKPCILKRRPTDCSWCLHYVGCNVQHREPEPLSIDEMAESILDDRQVAMNQIEVEDNF